MRRTVEYLRTFLFVMAMPVYIADCLLLEPRRLRGQRRKIVKQHLERLGVSACKAAEVVQILPAGDAEQARRRQELVDRMRQPLAKKLALGVLLAQLLVAGLLYGSSRARIPWFACLAAGYTAVAALLAGFYEMWKGEVS